MLDKLINQERKDYKCFNLLKELYNTNNEFKQFIDEYDKYTIIHILVIFYNKTNIHFLLKCPFQKLQFYVLKYM